MTNVVRRVASLVAIAGACACASAPPAEPVVELPVTQPLVNTGRVEILWDTYGVPHIFAQDVAALAYAFGWAQMRNHADLLLRLYGQARGRAAEYWGADFVESDMWVRTNGIPARAAEWFGQQSPHARAMIEAFVAGVNAYASQHADSIGAMWRQVLPIQATDVLAHQQRVLNFTFIVDPGVVAGASRAVSGGSNAWAIAPSRSGSRTAMLMGNPHLPWGDLFTWMEAHFVGPDIDAYGAALVGMPILNLGFNQFLGWTHTVNTFDGADLYALRTNGDYYLLDDTMRAMQVEDQTIRVRQPDGSMAARQLRIRRSVHGPIIAESGDRAIALAVTGLDAPHLLRQTWDMLRARNLGEFEAALSRLQLPMFTTIYADREGNIMHVFNGRVPVRTRGDWAHWRGIVNGDSSRTRWTGTHAYMGLPRVLNPTSGWLQNANDPPWTTTLPWLLDPSFFPAYMSPEPFMSFRAQRSMRLLAEDDRITFDELITYRNSTRLEAADHIVLDLIAAARGAGDNDARAAADVLERWDRNTDAESRGAVLFLAYLRAMGRANWPGNSPFEIGWTARAPLSTPDGLSDPRRAAQLLGDVAREVRSRYGSLDIAWGDVYRMRSGDVDLPAVGGPDAAGAFRVLNFRPLREDSTRFIASGGDSFIFAIEFTTPMRAQVLLTYGNASQEGSPHRTDQLPLYARKEMRTAWLTRDEVMANLKAREAF